MPERDDMSGLRPDPIDEAYLRAEQALDDEAARTARRARVLAAVAKDAEAPAAPTPSLRRPIRRYGGWLAAACVAGLSVWTAQRVYRPAPQAGAPAAVVAAPPAPSPAPAQPPSASAPPRASSAPPPPTPRRRAFAKAEPAPAAPPADIAPPPPLPIPPVQQPFAAAGAAKAGPPTQEAVVVSGSRIERREAPAEIARPLAQALDAGARLREAAAAGRTADIETLLAQGVAVDAADEAGETALMKSIEAGRRDAAALLRRHGASLDQKNHAGVSARDMAAKKNDPELDQALGLPGPVSPSAAGRP